MAAGGRGPPAFAEIAPDAQQKLVAYDWPGNVRELANVIERAVVLGQGPTITVHDLPPRVVAAGPGAQSTRLSYREGVDANRRELVLEPSVRPRATRLQRPGVPREAIRGVNVVNRRGAALAQRIAWLRRLRANHHVYVAVENPK